MKTHNLEAHDLRQMARDAHWGTGLRFLRTIALAFIGNERALRELDALLGPVWFDPERLAGWPN